MDKDIAGRNGPRRVTYMEIKRIVLTVASAVLNPGMSSFFSLMPISLWFHWSVRVSFDVDRYSEQIINSRVKHNDQVTKELECLSKFYKPENGRCHESFPPAKSRAPTHTTYFRAYSPPRLPSPRFRQPNPTRSDRRPPLTIFASHPTFKPPIGTTQAHPHIPSEDNTTASHVADHVTDTKPRACRTTASSGHLPSQSRPRGFQPPFCFFLYHIFIFC